METVRIAQPQVGGDEIFRGLASEPTFSVSSPFTFALTRDRLIFDGPTELTIPRRNVERVELQDWWEKFRRIVVVYRDESGNTQSKTFVAARTLGPDAEGTLLLFDLLQKEFGAKAHNLAPVVEEVPEKKADGPAGSLVIMGGLIVVLGFLGGVVGAAFGVVGGFLISRLSPTMPRVARIVAGTVIAMLSVAGTLIVAPLLAVHIMSAMGVVPTVAPDPNRFPASSVLTFLGRGGVSPEQFDRVKAIQERRNARQVDFPAAEAVQPDIQAAADALSDALWRGDKTAYFANIDKSNDSWKQVQEDWFDYLKGEGKDESVKQTVEVVSVQPAPAKGFYKARVRITTEHSKYDDGVEEGWQVYRSLDGKLLLSEPDERMLGNRLAKEGQKVSVVYWEWDKEQLDRLVPWADNAYAKVVGKLGQEPSKKPRVIFRPIYRSYSADYGPQEMGFFSMLAPDEVYARSPESFGGATWKEGSSQEEITTAIIAHELTHLVANDKFVPLQQTPLWLAEGLAEHVAGHYRTKAVRHALDQGKLPSLADLDRPSRSKEPISGNVFYGEGAYAVRYIDERWGMDTYWELVKRRSKTGTLTSAVRDVMNISLDQFESDFKGWLRERLAEE